jgi:hypothetical protein
VGDIHIRPVEREQFKGTWSAKPSNRICNSGPS